MPPDMSGARGKIERAKKHIAEFSREQALFIQANPEFAVADFDANTNLTTYRLGELPHGLPINFSLIAGDAIHNLRVALDYVVAELVGDAGGDTGRVYFPICESAKKYKAESDGKTKGLPPASKKIIDSLRPYAGGDDRFWGLHKLDIADKHRLLTATRIYSSGVAINGNMALRTWTSVPSKPGDMIAEVHGPPQNQNKLRCTFDIGFGGTQFFKASITRTLWELGLMVEGVVAKFVL